MSVIFRIFIGWNDKKHTFQNHPYWGEVHTCTHDCMHSVVTRHREVEERREGGRGGGRKRERVRLDIEMLREKREGGLKY